jgi:hypothetical protein
MEPALRWARTVGPALTAGLVALASGPARAAPQLPSWSDGNNLVLIGNQAALIGLPTILASTAAGRGGQRSSPSCL